MSSKCATNKDVEPYVEPYLQAPRVLVYHPLIRPEHITVFIHIYDDLRQGRVCSKSNEYLCLHAKVGLSQLKKKLNDLETWGFLTREGLGVNRKFHLGNKFNNRSEFNPVQNQNRPESNPVLAGKQPSNRPEYNLPNKNTYKNTYNQKNSFPFSFSKDTTPEQQADILHFLKYPGISMPEELEKLIIRKEIKD